MDQPDWRAEMYQTLAEALAEPADWLAMSGREWPLTQAAQALASESEAAGVAAPTLAGIAAEPLSRRQSRYAALLGGRDRPNLSPYESMQRYGSLLSPATHSVEQLYRVAGLTPDGAELPDHAAFELAFLGYLAARQTAEPAQAARWARIERGFIRRHAGQWLPALGRALAESGDPVYGPIGQLLAGWLSEAARPPRRRVAALARQQPAMLRAEACHLCGFCVQVCPTQALMIRESADQTALILTPSACTGCLKCEAICNVGALHMIATAETPAAAPRLLRRSPRVICPGCGQATVSQAEYDFVAAQIGPAPWLARCLPCRAATLEQQR